MKDLRAALMEKGFKDNNKQDKRNNKNNKDKARQQRIAEQQRKIEEREERKKRLNAQPKDKILKMAFTNNKDAVYTLTAYIDSISIDNFDNVTTIVSMNCIYITINGKTYVMDHTHVRGDRVTIDSNWKEDQKITFKAKIQRYDHGKQQKYELINIF